MYCKHQHPSSIALLLRRDEIACSTLCKCTSRYSNTIFAFSTIPSPYRPSCRARYCKHACDCVTTTSQRVQSRLAPSPTLASNDVRTGAPTHERSFQLVVNIIRFCRDLAVTLYCCFGNFTCSLVLEPLLGTAPGVLQSAVFSQQAPQALRVQRHTFTLRKCSL